MLPAIPARNESQIYWFSCRFSRCWIHRLPTGVRASSCLLTGGEQTTPGGLKSLQPALTGLSLGGSVPVAAINLKRVPTKRYYIPDDFCLDGEEILRRIGVGFSVLYPSPTLITHRSMLYAHLSIITLSLYGTFSPAVRVLPPHLYLTFFFHGRADLLRNAFTLKRCQPRNTRSLRFYNMDIRDAQN